MPDGLRLTARLAAVLLAGLTAACCACSPCHPAALLPVVHPPAGPEADLRIDFANITEADRPLLLFSGHRAGACRSFEPYVATASSSVQLSMVAWDPACPVEFDVFTPYFGAYVRTVTAGNPADIAWFENGLGLGVLSLPLAATAPVKVADWIVAGTTADRSAARSLRDTQFADAAPLLEGLGAGFQIVRNDGLLSPSSVPNDCASATTISSMSSGYDPSAINVYYVKYYLDSEYGSYAIDCWMEGHPEIVFVSWGNPNTPFVSLAHELGHALGLIIPTDPTIGGHTNSIYGEYGTNLMVSGASSVTFITVGQLYGMNFDDFSWVNRPAVLPRPLVRHCQDSFLAGVCPAVPMEVAGWPVP